MFDPALYRRDLLKRLLVVHLILLCWKVIKTSSLRYMKFFFSLFILNAHNFLMVFLFFFLK